MKDNFFFPDILPCRWIWKSSSPQQCWMQPSWHHNQASATVNTHEDVVKQTAYSQRQCYSKTCIHADAFTSIQQTSTKRAKDKLVDLRRWACTLHWLWRQCCPVWVPAWSRRCMWRCIWPVERQRRKWHTELGDSDRKHFTSIFSPNEHPWEGAWAVLGCCNTDYNIVQP